MTNSKDTVTISREEYDRMQNQLRLKSNNPKGELHTHVCVLLDESGSMQARKAETISGFNNYLKDLNKDEGDEVLFTFTLFNSARVDQRYNALTIKDVPLLNNSTYSPDHGTPLHDAIGKTINEMKTKIKKDDLVIFAIFTDGEENESREYDLAAVKQLITEQEKSGWKFVFLGVGIDAFAIGSKMGLNAHSNFNVAPTNMSKMYATVGTGTSNLRSTRFKSGISATACMNVVSESERKKLSES